MKMNNEVTKNQPVSFAVESVEKANKEGYAKVEIRFLGSYKTYDYIRKASDDSNHYKQMFVIIDGCKVSFDYNYDFISTERVYDTKGFHKKDTSNISGNKFGGSHQKSEEDEYIEKAQSVIDKVIDEFAEVDLTGPVYHNTHDDIVTCLENDIPVYLAGPAGAGKNFTVEQIAEELGWNFYFTNSVQQEYKLTGFIDAGGEFHETEFYKACTDDEECIFFLDEIDASIPEVLVLINAAIANGYFEFPNGKVNLKHVHFVSAGNTVGSGADDMYTGRLVLDAATLDRFVIIDFGYDTKIEMLVSKNNKELVKFVHQLREKAENEGIRATFSLRCIIDVEKLEGAGMSLDKIMKYAVLKGMDKDTINTFFIPGNSKYHKALNEVQKVA